MMQSLRGLNSPAETGPAGRRLVALVAPAALVLMLTACGGSSSAGASASSPTSAASARTRAGGMGDDAEFQKIQQCLTAAGISLPTPGMGARPGVRPGGTPGARPSGAPGGDGGTPPSGAPGGGRGGFGGMGTVLQSADAKAALKACGLTVPTARPTAT